MSATVKPAVPPKPGSDADSTRAPSARRVVSTGPSVMAVPVGRGSNRAVGALGLTPWVAVAVGVRVVVAVAASVAVGEAVAVSTSVAVAVALVVGVAVPVLVVVGVSVGVAVPVLVAL